MKRWRLQASAWTMGAAMVFGAVPALAHHSFAMFDTTRLVTLTGTVKEFRWVNPHVTLWLLTDPKDGGQPETWSIEFTSPGNLSRIGMTRTSFNPGDRVVAEIDPLRDGEHGGAFEQVTVTATGVVFKSGRSGKPPESSN